MAADTKTTTKSFVYFGAWIYHVACYGTFSGVYDRRTRRLSDIHAAPVVTKPSFMVLSPDKRFLYSTEHDPCSPNGKVSAFSICPLTGRLSLINQVSSRGRFPCHIAIDSSGRCVFVSNFRTGSVALYKVEADGGLSKAKRVIRHKGKGKDPGRQNGSHVHSVTLDAGNRFAFATDLGLDKIFIYRFNEKTGSLRSAAIPFIHLAPGSGPRHFTFSPDGRHAYVINELSNTIDAFSYDPESGKLTAIQTISTLPRRCKSKSYASEIMVHPSGRYLYGANRLHGSIAVFAIDRPSGKLSLTGIQDSGGSWPHSLTLAPGGRQLLVCDTRAGNISVFDIELKTGRLKESAEKLSVSALAFIKFGSPCPTPDRPRKQQKPAKRVKKTLRLLIVGGGGYVGSIVAPSLKERFDCLHYDLNPVKGHKKNTIMADVSNEEKIRQAISGADAVLYMPMGKEKTRTGLGQNGNAIAPAFDVNVRGLYKFLLYSLIMGVKRFIYVSSLSVYSIHTTGLVNEETPADAWHTPYGLSKRTAEFICEASAQAHESACVTALRLYGPLNDKDWKDRGERRRRNPLFLGPDDTRRLFNAVVDFCEPGFHLFQASGDREGKRFPNDLIYKSLGWRPRGK